jgi:hypothetical protein
MFKTRSGLKVVVESKDSVSVTGYIVKKNGELVGYDWELNGKVYADDRESPNDIVNLDLEKI